MLPFLVLTGVVLPLLLIAEFKNLTGLRWVVKPIASASFVAAAVAGGASQTIYGRWVIAALVFSLLGDVLLMPRGERSFLAGLVCFLFGHVAFTMAFALHGINGLRFTVALLVMCAAGFLSDRWLAPNAKGTMLVAVRVYIGVITLMVATAAGSQQQRYLPLVLAGVMLFYISDLAVARERFVTPTPFNKLWGLPLYYAAQLMLAMSASSHEAMDALLGG